MNPPSNRDPETPGKILIRSVNWLGDAVMTTPAILRLREKWPATRLALLTPEKLAPLWQDYPAIDQIISFRPQDRLWQTARRLRLEHFNIALVFPNSPRAAIEAWWSRIPRRIGCAASWRSWFLTDAVPPWREAVAMRKRSLADIRSQIHAAALPRPSSLPPSAHQVHHYLGLAGVLGADTTPLAPRLFVAESEVQAVCGRLGLGFEEGHPWVGLNAGAEYGPAKRWPRGRFIAAAVELHRRTHCRWVILGGPRDGELARDIAGQLLEAIGRAETMAAPARQNWVLNLAGATTLRELCAVLKACRVLLTNDTGPMHVAAALGTPVVVPFGSTSPELTGPGLPGDPRHRLLKSPAPCSPCFRRECPIDFRCMSAIGIDQVVRAVADILGQA